MSWRARAICRDEEPELFFPIGTHGPARAQLAAAKQVCSRCPVTADCLRFALGRGEIEGVWGGTSEDDRRGLGASAQGAPRW